MTLVPSPAGFGDWRDWAFKVMEALRGPAVVRPLQLAVYPKSRLPPASADGLFIFVPDDIGGATPAVSSGGQWLRTSDLAQIS